MTGPRDGLPCWACLVLTTLQGGDEDLAVQLLRELAEVHTAELVPLAGALERMAEACRAELARREADTPVDVCPEPGCAQRGAYDGRVHVGGRGVYRCPAGHVWVDLREAQDDSGYVPVEGPVRR
ncbi:MAG TPA: hypothetical protein VFM54_09255 [Micromonosporaceae bacterium]|nr:hypothetical protein [Micromonosporaceae bacterium]